jgi:hypothetical protein
VAVNKSQLIETLRQQVFAIDEVDRIPGFRQELLVTLAEIIEVESANRVRKTSVQQEVTGRCENLGMTLLDGGWQG